MKRLSEAGHLNNIIQKLNVKLRCYVKVNLSMYKVFIVCILLIIINSHKLEYNFFFKSQSFLRITPKNPLRVLLLMFNH